MAAIGPMAFALVLWGSLLGIALVFVYEVYVIAREAGWLPAG